MAHDFIREVWISLRNGCVDFAIDLHIRFISLVLARTIQNLYQFAASILQVSSTEANKYTHPFCVS